MLPQKIPFWKSNELNGINYFGDYPFGFDVNHIRVRFGKILLFGCIDTAAGLDIYHMGSGNLGCIDTATCFYT